MPQFGETDFGPCCMVPSFSIMISFFLMLVIVLSQPVKASLKSSSTVILMVPALIDEAAFFLFLTFGTPTISCAIGFIAGVFEIFSLLLVI
jgi:hypothetical protein